MDKEEMKKKIKDFIQSNSLDIKHGLGGFAIYYSDEDYEEAKAELIEELIESSYKLEKTSDGLSFFAKALDEELYSFIKNYIKEVVEKALDDATKKFRPDFKEIAIEDYLDKVFGTLDDEKSAPELLEVYDYVRQHDLLSLLHTSRDKTTDERIDYIVSTTKDKVENDETLKSIPATFVGAIKDIDYVGHEKEYIKEELEEEIEDGSPEEEIEDLKTRQQKRIEFLTRIKADEQEIFTRVLAGKIAKIIEKEMKEELGSVRDVACDSVSDEVWTNGESVTKLDVFEYLKRSEFFKKIAMEFKNYIKPSRIAALLVVDLEKNKTL